MAILTGGEIGAPATLATRTVTVRAVSLEKCVPLLRALRRVERIREFLVLCPTEDHQRGEAQTHFQ